MTSSSLDRGDLWLWLGLGIAGALTFYSARQHLYAVREVVKVTNEEPPPDIIGQHTEDAISIDTLNELYNSPNWDIEQASTRIIVERIFRNTNTIDLLLRNARSKSPFIRDQALASLRFLSVGSPTSAQATLDTLLTPKSLKTLINILITFLPQNATRPHHPHTDWRHRTPAERDIFSILQTFVRVRTKDLLTAGLVERWLARYPFGGSKLTDLSEPKEREVAKRHAFAEIKKGHTDDVEMCYILDALDYDAEGRRQLRKHGLIGSAMEEGEMGTEMWVLRDGVAVPGPGWPFAGRGGNWDGSGEGLNRRERREESEEEVALRRRRRQAMVISERGEPLSRDSIIESVEVDGR